jgi:hypothetical protein
MPNFQIENRGGTDVVVYDDNSCRTATSEESELAMRLSKVEKEFLELKTAVLPVAKLTNTLRDLHSYGSWEEYMWSVGAAKVTSQEMDSIARLCGEG